LLKKQFAFLFFNPQVGHRLPPFFVDCVFVLRRRLLVRTSFFERT